ncbi:hypothetical protein [Methylomonas koyamae]|uniref:hypothetical protein n=1 Tax=Methylomonas koyamae TaxID=702114 RepID=UPI00210F2D48|nr:hypothetical protein [Methylomonas koyamae]
MAELRHGCALTGYAYEVLFSRRCFKQRGALYSLRGALPVQPGGGQGQPTFEIHSS